MENVRFVHEEAQRHRAVSVVTLAIHLSLNPLNTGRTVASCSTAKLPTRHALARLEEHSGGWRSQECPPRQQLPPSVQCDSEGMHEPTDSQRSWPVEGTSSTASCWNCSAYLEGRHQDMLRSEAVGPNRRIGRSGPTLVYAVTCQSRSLKGPHLVPILTLVLNGAAGSPVWR